MHASAPDSPVSHRLPYLDALRGVAALVVFFTHCYAIWPEGQRQELYWINHTPLRMFINGSAAVTFFFVLSGYVLALPFLAGRAPRWKNFIVRRFCRIYLPFSATILFAWLLYLFVGGMPVPGTSPWFEEQWRTPFNWIAILRHLALIGTVADMNLNSSIWTIIVELRVALIFSGLIWLCRSTVRGGVTAVICYVLCTWLLRTHSPPLDPALLDTDSFGTTFLITGRQIPFFMMGILVAKHQAYLQSLCLRLPFFIALPMWLACFAVLCAPHYTGETVLESLMAALLLATLPVMPLAQKTLVLPPLLWLGRISYSFYLIHIPVLFTLFHIGNGHWPFWTVVLLAALTSLLVALVVHIVIEAPAIRLGQRLGKSSSDILKPDFIPV